MTDGHFVERHHLVGEELQVVQVQIVACIDPQSAFMGQLSSGNKGFNGFVWVAEKMLGIGACEQFDAVRPRLCSPLDQIGFRAEEQAGAYPLRAEIRQNLPQKLLMLQGIPTSIRCQYARRVWHERDLFWTNLEHELNEIFRGIPFDIELCGHRYPKFSDVFKGDVSSVGAGMDRDAIRPPLLQPLGGRDRTREFSPSRISEGRDFVDVDAEARGESFHGLGTAKHRRAANFAKSPFPGRTKSMHAASIINEELIALTPGDTLEKALRAMDELKVEHLPVVAEGKYLGLVAEEHLLDQEGESVFLTNVRLMPVMVAPGQHFLEVVDVLCEADVSVVPVVEEGVLLGCTDRTYLWRAFHNSLTPYSEGSILTLEMPWKDYSLAQVSHRVESEGVKILQVLVSDGAQPENAEVALRLSTRNIEALIDSLRRHGYDVRAFYRAEEYAEEMKRRMAALRRYMNI